MQNNHLNSNVFLEEHFISKNLRQENLKQKPMIIWFTGLSGSGKSTLANGLEKELFKRGLKTYLLDGDNLRHGLNSDLGFSKEDREENIRRVGHVASLMVDAGLIVITAFISPYEKERAFVRNLVKENEFIEIFVDTPLQVCEQRDTKGLYKKAREGLIKDFTGVNAPYEKPKNPEVHIQQEEINDAIGKILEVLNY